MKKLIISLISLLPFLNKAQTDVHYSYDLNGNRIQRYIIGIRPPNEENGTPKDSTITVESPKSDLTQAELVEKYGVTVYPNPTADLITVDLRKAGVDMKNQKATIQLIDNSGKLLATKNYSGNGLDFNLAGNNPGTYYLRIFFKSGETLYYKVVKIN